MYTSTQFFEKRISGERSQDQWFVYFIVFQASEPKCGFSPKVKTLISIETINKAYNIGEKRTSYAQGTSYKHAVLDTLPNYSWSF